MARTAAWHIGCSLVFVLAASMPSSADDPFTLVQLCDTQLGMGGYEHDIETFRLAVTHINRLKPDLVLVCGDLVNTADTKSFDDFLAIKSEIAAPSHCTPGNHDIGNDADAKLLAQYRERIGKDYYTFDHKGYRFICVNTQLWKSPVAGESEKQDVWLAETLNDARAKKLPVIVFGHISLFADKPDEPEEYFNIAPEKRAALLVQFKESGVVAYLSGHSHRNEIHDDAPIQCVAGASTSKNFDHAPMGFTLWHIGPERPLKHEYVPVEGAKPPEDK